MEPASVSTAEFGDLLISYDDRVLTPRPWTAQQSRWAAQMMTGAPAGAVLELCCGAGHIGLLATALTPEPVRRRLVAVDINPAAVDLTVSNAAAAELTPWVEARHGDIAEVLDKAESFALIIADPPWVPAAQTGRYPHDPPLAINGGVDGLALARRCLEVAAQHLAPQGAIVLQLGTTEQVAELAPASHGLSIVEVRQGERGVLVHLRADAHTDR